MFQQQNEAEIETRKLEQDKLRLEERKLEAEQRRIELENETRRAEIDLRERISESNSQTNVGSGLTSQGGPRKFDLGVGKWNPESNLQSIITRFEVCARAYSLP
jgi:hypothetical protein